MKVFVASLVLGLSTFLFAQTANVGIFQHYPLVYQDDTSTLPKGAGLEYIKAVLHEMGITPVFKFLPFARMVNDLKSGDIDIAFDLVKTPDRENFLYYADEPAIVLHPALTVRADNPLNKITSSADLSGMRIGFLLNSVVPKILDSPNIKLDLTGSSDWVKENLGKLLAGHDDGVFDQTPYSYAAVAKLSGSLDKIKVLILPGEGAMVYVVFSKKSKDGLALLNSYNKVAASKKYDYSKYLESEVK
jgi:ABC-type amino acid transport substrate-binding protein